MENFPVSDFINACRTGSQLEIQKMLVSHPDLLEITDNKHGWTPLYRTIMCGNLAASEFLISLGANCNAKDDKGFSILYQAVSNSKLKESILLIHSKANINEIQPGKSYIDGNTVLHKASQKNSTELARILLDSSADPNIKNANGKTPLHIAVESNNSDLIKLLLNSNANPGLKDSSGRSASDLCRPEQRPLFLSHFKLSSDKSPRNSPLLLPFPETVEIIPEIPLESFTSLNLSPVSATSKLLFENFEKQCSTYIESEKNEGRHSKAFSFGGNSTNLYKWLESVRLEFLYDVLMMGGFDDIDQMVLQMKSKFGITEEMLESIGIDKPGYRKRLLAALDEEVRIGKSVRRHRQTQSNPLKFCYLAGTCSAGIVSASDLKQWLEVIKLPQYYEQFVESGYEDLEHLLCLMNSRWPVNEAVLAGELSIQNQNHRYKLIMKLKNESFGFDSMKKTLKIKGDEFFDRNKESTACELCSIF